MLICELFMLILYNIPTENKKVSYRYIQTVNELITNGETRYVYTRNLVTALRQRENHRREIKEKAEFCDFALLFTAEIPLNAPQYLKHV